MRYEGDIKAMMKGYMKKTTLKISEIKNNPNNPRLIKNDKFKKLVKSIQEFPEMLDTREIVVNKDRVILGGNMRFKAAKEAGLKEVPVKIVDWDEDKQRQFIIKDNVSGGEWDWDLLAEQYDMEELEAWGVDTGLIDKDGNEASLEKINITDEVLKLSYEPEQLDYITFEIATEKDERYDSLKELVSEIKNEEVKKILEKRLNDFVGYNFDKIADYYATGATEKERQAFRKTGLVFSTTREAIENGFALADDLLDDINGEA